MRAERLITISRDAGCLIVGLGGIVHQQITGQVSEALLAVYVALLGVPAGIGLLSLRGGTGTTGPSSSSPDPPHSPVPSSPRSSPGAGEP